MAVPNSIYTIIPAAAINIPATQMNRANPTLPDRLRMADGVAKIPVPMIRLKMRNVAETTPI